MNGRTHDLLSKSRPRFIKLLLWLLMYVEPTGWHFSQLRFVLLDATLQYLTGDSVCTFYCVSRASRPSAIFGSSGALCLLYCRIPFGPTLRAPHAVHGKGSANIRPSRAISCHYRQVVYAFFNAKSATSRLLFYSGRRITRRRRRPAADKGRHAMDSCRARIAETEDPSGRRREGG